MTPIRIGVIGCGAIAQVMHLPYLADHPEQFEIAALADVSGPTVEAVGERYGIERRYTDWRAMLANESVDAVGLFHGGSHHDTTIAALDAGKHVVVEKPLAWNLREAREVQAAAHKSDRTVQVAYHKLYDPGFGYAKQEIDKMRDLGFARITVLHPWNDLGLSPHRIRRGNGRIDEGHREPPTLEEEIARSLSGFTGPELGPLANEVLGDRADDPQLQVAFGIMTSSLIHQVYSMFGFLGTPNRVISTDVWRGGFSIHSVIEYSDNLLVTMDWHQLTHLKDYREEYAFYGNYERVTMQLPSPYFKHFPSPVIVQGGEGELAWEKRVTVSYEEAFHREWAAFYENVTQGKTPISNVDEAVKHMAFIQQMIEAAR